MNCRELRNNRYKLQDCTSCNSVRKFLWNCSAAGFEAMQPFLEVEGGAIAFVTTISAAIWRRCRALLSIA